MEKKMKQSVKTWAVSLLAVCMVSVAAGIVTNSVFAEQTKSLESENVESVVAPSRALKNVKGCSFESGVKSPEETLEEYTGVKVTTGTGVSTFQYNGICNLKESGEFISFLFLPKELGTAEANDFVITLTDVYDSSKYLTLDFYDGYRSNYPMATWLACSESGKYTPFGYEYNGAKLSVGTSIACTWRGLIANNQGTTDWQETCLYYDVEEKALFTYSYSRLTPGGIFQNGYQNYQSKKLVFDFDDKNYLDTNIFEGFTTDEVYITVDISSNVNAHLLVTKLGGVDLGEEELPSQSPVISLDYQGYDENNLPYGVAGADSSYPVFDAIAYSAVDGVFAPQEITVLYGTESVPVVDGRFATEKVGVYSINYTATSVRGENTRKSVRVLVKNAYNEQPGYLINQDIPDTVYVGTERIYLPDGEAYGGSGNLKVSVSLASNGEPLEIHTQGNAKYFVPEVKSGTETTYVLTYEIEDITGRKTLETKNIRVAYSQKPVIEKVKVPIAIRKDYVTKFAKAEALFVADGIKKEVPVKIRVNGEFLSDALTYEPKAEGVLLVEYVAYHPDYPNDEGKAAIEQYEVAVLALKTKTDENGKNPEYSSSYFYTSGMEYSEALSMCVEYEKTAENAMFTYANLLSASSLKLIFDMNKNTSEGFDVVLQDGVNPLEKVVLSVRNRLGLPALYLGDKLLGALGGSLIQETAQQMQIVYDNYAYNVYGRNGEYIGAITNYENGLPFEGFTSGSVYVSFEFDERTDTGAKFSIYSLNGHNFSKVEKDNKSPDISLNNSIPTLRYEEYGSTVLVSGAKAWDVFGSVTSLKVKVTAPDKTVVYEGNIDKDYTFTANQYGTYNIVYTAIDNSLMSATKRTSVCILDTQAPTIQDGNSFKAVYSVGDKISLPEIVAKDNKDEHVGTYYVIILPTGEWKVVTAASYTFTMKGNYVIREVAVDEALNTAYREFDIIVK